MPDPNDDSFLPIGPEQSASPVLPPSVKHHALSLYCRAWQEYQEAGCPYGASDEAMLVWQSLPPGIDALSPITSRN